jgi:hypothetical protein
MSNSIADPVITLKILMDQAALSSVNSQMSDALRKGIQGTEPLFEKLEQFLETAVSKADIGSQIRKQLESGFRALKNTGGTESLVKDFERLEQAGIRFGDSFVQAAARVGQAVASVHRENSKLIDGPSVHPSWDAARSADWNRRLHVAVGIENRSNELTDRLRNADFSKGSSGHDSTGMIAGLTAFSRAATADTAYEQRSAAVSSAEEHSRLEWEQIQSKQAYLANHQRNVDIGLFNAKTKTFRRSTDNKTALAVYNRLEAHRLATGSDVSAQHQDSVGSGQFISDTDERLRQREARRLEREAIFRRERDQYATDQQRSADLYRTNRAAVDYHDSQRLENYRDPRRPLETPEASQARYASMPEYQRRNMDAARARAERRTSGGGAFNSHNFRFASQNAAFGIDDAIQSYHYGGFAASARAASNNLTAIAGMGIANPAAAAGVVIGLSILTAAVPVLMKKFGIDSEEQIKARTKYAEADYTKTGSISGSISRGTAGLSTMKEAAEGYFNLRDQEHANTDMRGFAQGLLNRSAGNGINVDVNDDLSVGFARRGVNPNDKNALAKFDQAVKWLKEDQLSSPERQSKLNEAEAKSAYVHKELPAVLKRQEEQRVRDRVADKDRYHADTIEDFNASITSAFNRDVAALRGQPADVQRQRIRELEAKKWEDINNRSENFRTVQANKLERGRSAQDAMLSALGFTGGLASSNVNFNRAYHDTSMNVDGKLNGKGITERLGFLREGHEKLSGRMLEDEVRANKGFNDPLSSLSIDFQRKQQDYADLRNPYTDKQRAALLKSNKEGFDFNRKQLIAGMLGEHEINNPMGFLARDFKKDAIALERRFADAGNNLTADEKMEMELNLKRDFQLQKRHANTPHGTEQFMANAIDIGSSQDNELRARMMGNFSRPKDDNGWQTQTLEQFRIMVTELQQLNSNLTIAAQGLK